MNSEIIGLFDTAIKIGLGALIVAVSNYLISRNNYKNEENKEFVKRYIDSLDNVTIAAEDFFQKWNRLTSSTAGISKITTEKNIQYTQKHYKFIKTNDDEFVNSRNKRMTAISKLKLLKLNDVAKTLENTIEIEKEFRNIIFFEDRIPKTNVIYDFDKKMDIQRELFYKSLSSHYKLNKLNNS